MIITIIIFIILLSVLVFAHELGHFLTARIFGVKAEEFGFGFPPRLIGWQKIKGIKRQVIAEEKQMEITADEEGISESISAESVQSEQSFSRWRTVIGADDPCDKTDEEVKQAGTIYSLNWLPLGGFVKIKGEQGEGESDPDSLVNQPIWRRAIIMSAGVIMNLVIAAIFLSICFIIGMPQALDDNSHAAASDRKLQIVQVVPNSPAAAAGLKIGDIISSISGQSFADYESLSGFTASHEGKELRYQIKRGSQELLFNITPAIIAETGQPGAGIAVAETGIVRYPWYRAIWEGVKSTVLMTWYVISAFVIIIKNLLIGQGAGVEVSGPVGIAVMTGQAAQLGFVYILQFAAILSINLAVVNYLPLPALDGGRVLFLIIEKIRGRAVPVKTEAIIHNVGFSLLILLVVIITFKDIFKFSDKFIALWHQIF